MKTILVLHNFTSQLNLYCFKDNGETGQKYK